MVRHVHSYKREVEWFTPLDQPMDIFIEVLWLGYTKYNILVFIFVYLF